MHIIRANADDKLCPDDEQKLYRIRALLRCMTMSTMRIGSNHLFFESKHRRICYSLNAHNDMGDTPDAIAIVPIFINK